jgi:hypothetical protein
MVKDEAQPVPFYLYAALSGKRGIGVNPLFLKTSESGFAIPMIPRSQIML